MSAWPVLVNEGMPRQRDSHNWGAFIIGFAYFLGQGAPCVFGSRNGRILHHRITLDLSYSLGGS